MMLLSMLHRGRSDELLHVLADLGVDFKVLGNASVKARDLHPC